MTKQEILQRQAEIDLQRNSLRSEVIAHKTVLKVAIEDILLKRFIMNRYLPEGVKLGTNKYRALPFSYPILMVDEEGKDREILNIYLQESWNWEIDETYVDKVYPSYYTTSTVSNFEFKRMMVLGIVGKVFLEQGEELLRDINQAYITYYPEVNRLTSKIYDLEKESNELDKILKHYAKEELQARLFTGGITFKDLPRINFNKYFDFFGVISIKATMLGSTFCKLEVNTDKGMREIDKIKLEKVFEVLDRYSTRIEQIEEQVVS